MPAVAQKLGQKDASRGVSQVAGGSMNLGQVLVERGLVTSADIDKAMSVQERTGQRLGEILVDMGRVTETDVVGAVANQLGIPFLVGGDLQVDPRVAGLIEQDVASKYVALPIREEDGALVLAMADPLDIVAADDIGLITGRRIKVAMAGQRALKHIIRDFYDNLAQGALEPEQPAPDDPVLRQQVEDAPVVKLVDRVIQRAIDERASDIHVQPEEDRVRVRYRVDGILRDFGHVAASMLGAVVSRIKILAGMDISITRRPQDGRFQIGESGHPVDLRVSTFPTIHGEKAVLRILDQGRAITRLEDLGLSDSSLDRYREIVSRPHGMVMVAGPTGSGKTTTLVTTLYQINTPDKNILTIEDPVEYRVPGVNQAAVNQRAGLTFASALRSMVRQDPDIIMVGEIRDTETAEIAIRAALTGHLVLSSIHTNDAVSTVGRLLDMGIEPYLVASSLLGVASQRLVRDLCVQCRVAYRLEPGSPDHRLLGLPDRPLDLYRPGGCPACNRSGYRGRTGVYEVMVGDRTLREMIATRASVDDLLEHARQHGMMTMNEAAIERALMGATSLEEVRRVTYSGE